MQFVDRQDAGRQLGEQLSESGLADPVVLALPRGGVPVAYEVALALNAPLDVLVARKIGAPFQPEFGVGAIAEGGATVLDERSMASLGLSEEDLQATIAEEQAELERRIQRYRGGRAPSDVAGKSAVVVDDGLATGVTARAAVQSVRVRDPARVVLAVPTGAPATATAFEDLVDDVVCLITPDNFRAVGLWYQHFDQTSDETVVALLQRGRDREHGR